MEEMSSKVMEMVEKALEEDPGIKSGVLFERAKEQFPAVGELSIRQFHARYPLQIKRRMSMAAGDGAAPKEKKAPRRPSLRGRRRAAAAKAPSRGRRGTTRRQAAADAAAADVAPTPRAAVTPDTRDRVRAILLTFATELASADAKADVVKVLAGTDRYVDQLVGALDS